VPRAICPISQVHNGEKASGVVAKAHSPSAWFMAMDLSVRTTNAKKDGRHAAKKKRNESSEVNSTRTRCEQLEHAHAITIFVTPTLSDDFFLIIER